MDQLACVTALWFQFHSWIPSTLSIPASLLFAWLPIPPIRQRVRCQTWGLRRSRYCQLNLQRDHVTVMSAFVFSPLPPTETVVPPDDELGARTPPWKGLHKVTPPHDSSSPSLSACTTERGTTHKKVGGGKSRKVSERAWLPPCVVLVINDNLYGLMFVLSYSCRCVHKHCLISICWSQD